MEKESYLMLDSIYYLHLDIEIKFFLPARCFNFLPVFDNEALQELVFWLRWANEFHVIPHAGNACQIRPLTTTSHSKRGCHQGCQQQQSERNRVALKRFFSKEKVSLDFCCLLLISIVIGTKPNLFCENYLEKSSIRNFLGRKHSKETLKMLLKNL